MWSEVPAWFWPFVLADLALAVVIAAVLRSKLRSGAWQWRYQPEHAPRAALRVIPPVLDQTVPVAAVAGLPPWEPAEYSGGFDGAGDILQPAEWTGPELAALHDAPTVLDDLGPGAGFLSPGYNSHLPTGTGLTVVKVDSPAPDMLPPMLRLVSKAEAYARCDTFIEAMRADHERWMISARERWAA